MYEQPYNPYRNNIDIIKNYFKSPMVLVLGILGAVLGLVLLAVLVLSLVLVAVIHTKYLRNSLRPVAWG